MMRNASRSVRGENTHASSRPSSVRMPGPSVIRFPSTAPKFAIITAAAFRSNTSPSITIRALKKSRRTTDANRRARAHECVREHAQPALEPTRRLGDHRRVDPDARRDREAPSRLEPAEVDQQLFAVEQRGTARFIDSGIPSARASRFPVPPASTPTGVSVPARAPATSITVPSPPSANTAS